MKRLIIILCVLIPILNACKDKQAQEEVVEKTVTDETEDKLLGSITKEDLMNPAFSEWFDPAYEDYTVNIELLDS